jgi:hypothetical protein
MDRWTEQFFHGGREQGRRFHSPSAWARVHFALASLSSESDLPSLVELLQMFLYRSCVQTFGRFARRPALAFLLFFNRLHAKLKTNIRI